MKIVFSRHAKRRKKLYRIPEGTIRTVIQSRSREFAQGIHEIVEDVIGFEYPLKMVISMEEDVIIVVTVYPLKKGKRK